MLKGCNCLDKEDRELIINDLRNEHYRLDKSFKRALAQSPIRLTIDKHKRLIDNIENTPNCEDELSTDFIKKKEKSIQTNIEYLKVLMEDYKKGVEKCDVPKISSNSKFIESLRQLLDKDKKYYMDYQKKDIDSLEGEYIKSFQRLIEGHCECIPKRKL